MYIYIYTYIYIYICQSPCNLPQPHRNPYNLMQTFTPSTLIPKPYIPAHSFWLIRWSTPKP